MKILKKIKKENGRRQIYFCGIKVFSYKKNIFKPQNGNTIEWDGKKVSYIQGVTFCFKGKNSKVIVKGKTKFENSRFELGNNSEIVIEESEHIIRLSVWLGTGSKIELGKNFSSSGLQIHAANECNLLIKIGEECLCSWNVEIWASDGHTIFDCDTKKCLNIPKQVIIGKHVWLCKGSTILKNTTIPDHCIVARNAVVCGTKHNKPHCVLAGIPAKICKTNVDWDWKTTEQYLQEKEEK